MAKAFGIDIGYHAVKLFIPGENDAFLAEPAVVALSGNDSVAACGEEALALAERVPGTVRIVRPFSGEITPDPRHADAFLAYLIKKYRLKGADLIFSLSGRQDDDTEGIFVDAAQRAGARDVTAIDPVYAAALGCGVPSVAESAVINIGASVTDMACFSRGNVEVQSSCGCAGVAFDRAITSHMLKKRRLILSAEETERIKCLLGTLTPEGGKTAEVTALRSAMGVPQKAVVTEEELADCFEAVFDRLADEIFLLVRAVKLEPDRLILTGGGAKLTGLPLALAPLVGIPVAVAKEPEMAVIRGIAASMKRGKK
ncbi:MAG: rod shape-determining protein [Clostridia bacterium]|nr:rod shape-determining protein [Clostridia bacterium]